MGKATRSTKEQHSDSKTSSKKSDSATDDKKKKVKRPGTKFGAKKGKQFEREIATAVGHIFPDAQRMLEYQGSNVIGVDLENTDIFRFQCKCTANYKNPNAIFEIREKGPHVPVLVTKANNRPPMAVLPFQEFVTLLEMAYGHRERLINPYVKAGEQSVLTLAPIENFQLSEPSLLEDKLAGKRWVSPPTYGPKAGREGYTQLEPIEAEIVENKSLLSSFL